MRKIPTVLKRDPDDPRHVLLEVNPGCEWVLAGEGEATRKYDGTCLLLDADGRWWNRREIRAGKTMPDDAMDLGEDPATDKRMCWVPNTTAGNKVALVAALATHTGKLAAGTYELCAPNIHTRSGPNPEGLDAPMLVRHADATKAGWVGIRPLPGHAGAPRSVGGIVYDVQALGEVGWEGVVWHHPDGRMAKLKARDVPIAEPAR
jgi:hypothetical protein